MGEWGAVTPMASTPLLLLLLLLLLKLFRRPPKKHSTTISKLDYYSSGRMTLTDRFELRSRCDINTGLSTSDKT